MTNPQILAIEKNGMESEQMEKLNKILEYKERINQDVKDIRDLISFHKKPISSGDMIKDILEEQRIRSNSKDNEIKKKVDDIIHSMSCIGLLWREEKTGDFQKFLNSLQNLFNTCLNTEQRMKYQMLEFPLEMANSLVIPTHELKKWSSLIELEPLLAKIKIGFKNH